MIRDSKAFWIGILMLLSFCGIYIYMMSPSFGNGRNGLEFADDMFNSISKGSAQAVVFSEINKAEKWRGTTVEVNLTCKDEAQAGRWAAALQKAEGAEVKVDKAKIALKSDLGKLLANISEDCKAMYENKGDIVQAKYNTDPRDATNRWYSITKAIAKDLEKKQQFKESIYLQTYQKKVIEPAYNYYGVETKFVKDNKGIMTFMLVFYLFYTLWYGFAIYYICIGLGITMTKAAKKSEA
ncbi:hypothetical protein [Desulforamulus hydrothermalis]|uniref:Uncharacterized protein n=1 Tax=Desulforamulus hydrothermalis Lam5 = DSM 18033 TaxID=1121428 RepID=K8DXI7_9FIRM|nr:hypothetical protein [Desulforamulus hydrothermalis]CCO07357.1 conserved hypothetical protein [Desulforamulus hydrothermalis Lam5 = DSM 18033]SHG94774.1 hypothetical protein SAMN02745177_00901 [Desulforamulus hydrothermalis Lam5 = DSM 18033]